MIATNIKFTIDDVEYHWNGGLGSIFYSYEKGFRKGDLRAIDKYLFRVFRVDGKQVHWTTIEQVDYGWIRKFKAEVLL